MQLIIDYDYFCDIHFLLTVGSYEKDHARVKLHCLFVKIENQFGSIVLWDTMTTVPHIWCFIKE